MSSESHPQKKQAPQNKRILIVDDDESIRHMLQATVESEGFKVRTARDGRNILTAAQQYDPHLIISDVMMPGGGGYSLLQELQSDQKTKSIPIILITGKTFDASTKDVMSQEPNVIDFIEKPIRPFAFIKRIHDVLNTLTKEQVQQDRNKEIGGIQHNKLDDLF